MFDSMLAVYLLLAGTVAGQQPAWSQCGGQGYTGGTTCISGYSCVPVNIYYSQCQAGAAAPSMVTATKAASVATADPAPAPGTASTYRFLGRVNPATKELTWPGTGISFAFTGTSATITLAAVNGANSFDLVIDSGEPTVISNVVGTSISTPKLSQGSHTVVLRRRSETVLGTVSISGVTVDGEFVADKVLTR